MSTAPSWSMSGTATRARASWWIHLALGWKAPFSSSIWAPRRRRTLTRRSAATSGACTRRGRRQKWTRTRARPSRRPRTRWLRGRWRPAWRSSPALWHRAGSGPFRPPTRTRRTRRTTGQGPIVTSRPATDPSPLPAPLPLCPRQVSGLTTWTPTGGHCLEFLGRAAGAAGSSMPPRVAPFVVPPVVPGGGGGRPPGVTHPPRRAEVAAEHCSCRPARCAVGCLAPTATE
mmetsp:Transcript_6676/g.15889  ORF Transcript_6676/g.15889 Transcript_6676/m.15889 type:complete len:230 (-) Transcript_6676:163-852(-)